MELKSKGFMGLRSAEAIFSLIFLFSVLLFLFHSAGERTGQNFSVQKSAILKYFAYDACLACHFKQNLSEIFTFAKNLFPLQNVSVFEEKEKLYFANLSFPFTLLSVNYSNGNVFLDIFSSETENFEIYVNGNYVKRLYGKEIVSENITPFFSQGSNVVNVTLSSPARGFVIVRISNITEKAKNGIMSFDFIYPSGLSERKRVSIHVSLAE